MSASVQLDAGKLFGGDFRVVEPLKHGGMGSVYVVEQLQTGARRALKLMHPQLVQDPKFRKRFEQEARIGAQIPSEHVVQVIAAGVDSSSGTAWLVMELLEGEDLDKVNILAFIATALFILVPTAFLLIIYHHKHMAYFFTRLRLPRTSFGPSPTASEVAAGGNKS